MLVEPPCVIMSAVPVSWPLPPVPSVPSAPVSPRLAPVLANHPLSPLTAIEISTSSQLIHRLYPPRTDLHFKAVTLQEPNKAHLLPYLDAEHLRAKPPLLDRRSFVCYYIRNTVSRHAKTPHLAHTPR